MACDPIARLKSRFFALTQAWPGTVAIVPVLARPAGRAWAWAATPARRAARPSMELAGQAQQRPGSPTVEGSGSLV
jgi:hypothetical protein